MSLIRNLSIFKIVDTPNIYHIGVFIYEMIIWTKSLSKIFIIIKDLILNNKKRMIKFPDYINIPNI